MDKKCEPFANFSNVLLLKPFRIETLKFELVSVHEEGRYFPIWSNSLFIFSDTNLVDHIIKYQPRYTLQRRRYTVYLQNRLKKLIFMSEFEARSRLNGPLMASDCFFTARFLFEYKHK